MSGRESVQTIFGEQMQQIVGGAMFPWKPRHMAARIAGLAIVARRGITPTTEEVLPVLAHLHALRDSPEIITDPEQKTREAEHLGRLGCQSAELFQYADPTTSELLECIVTEQRLLLDRWGYGQVTWPKA